MSNNRSVTVTGLDETIKMLDDLGKKGDQIARNASSRAATLMRQGYLVQAMTSATGLSRRTIMRYSYVKRATPKYESARINFSGSGIPATEYKYSLKRTSVATRAQVLVEWLGGQKLAAGFINPLGKAKHPLMTRSQKTTRNGKSYTYRKPLQTALAPSLATLYLSLPEGEVDNEASEILSRELVTLLDELLDE